VEVAAPPPPEPEPVPAEPESTPAPPPESEAIPEPAAAVASAPAVGADDAAAESSGWDLPSMSAAAVASIRLAGGAQVEPPGAEEPPADLAWDAGAAATEPSAPPANGSGMELIGDDDAAGEGSEATEPLDLTAPEAVPDGSSAADEPESVWTESDSAAAEPAQGAVEPAEPAAAEQSPAPPTPPEWVPPRIHVTEFKGGVLSLVEPHRSLAEAAGALVEADYRNAALGRSFWWCETSQSGSAQIHTRQGLPDPYFFSRMLMWQPQ
jgi:hypothetical protein